MLSFSYYYHFYVESIKRRMLYNWIAPGLHIVMGVRAREQADSGAAARLSVPIYANFFPIRNVVLNCGLGRPDFVKVFRDFAILQLLSVQPSPLPFEHKLTSEALTHSCVCVYACFKHTHFCHQERKRVKNNFTVWWCSWVLKWTFESENLACV